MQEMTLSEFRDFLLAKEHLDTYAKYRLPKIIKWISNGVVICSDDAQLFDEAQEYFHVKVNLDEKISLGSGLHSIQNKYRDDYTNI